MYIFYLVHARYDHVWIACFWLMFNPCMPRNRTSAEAG